MLRVGFSGVPGSGKTSTARLVAAICRRCPGLHRVELLDKYARWSINTYGPAESVWEQVRILNKPLSREDKVPAANTDLLLTDSPVFMSFAYALARTLSFLPASMHVPGFTMESCMAVTRRSLTGTSTRD